MPEPDRFAAHWVPQDMAVAGFDDIPTDRASSRGVLTGCAHPRNHRSRLAFVVDPGEVSTYGTRPRLPLAEVTSVQFAWGLPEFWEGDPVAAL